MTKRNDPVAVPAVTCYNLQRLRAGAGYQTAREFADAMGIPATTYSRYEADGSRIPLDAAARLADHFGVSIDVIVGREDLDAPRRRSAQEVYDGLDARGRGHLDLYLEFLEFRDAAEGRY